MAVGVVAFECAVPQPQNTLHPEGITKVCLDLLLRKVAVAVRRHHAVVRGDESTLAVAFDCAAFKHEAEAVTASAAEYAGGKQLGCGEVITVGGEFQTPAVEFKVVGSECTVVVDSGDWAIIARPRIVGGHVYVYYIEAIVAGGQIFSGRLFGAYQYHFCPGCYGGYNVGIASPYFIEHVFPVGAGMRPRHKYGIGGFPFGWQT